MSGGNAGAAGSAVGTVEAVASAPASAGAGSPAGAREAALTAAERDKLPASDFAVPGKRMLPIHDREHCMAAWSMVERTQGLTVEERQHARQAILARMKTLGMDVSNLSASPMAGSMAGMMNGSMAGSMGMQAKEGHVLEAVCFEGELFEASAVPGERAVEVTIIRAGLSSNRQEYPAAVLRASVPMWEGAAAFVDHPSFIDESRAGGRSVRDLAGVYSDARWDEAGQGVRAKLRFNDQSAWLHDLVCEAIRDRAAGKAVPPLGISADMLVMRERLADRWKVHQVRAVTSADVVFRPSAGGRFERILEGIRGEGDGGFMDPEEGRVQGAAGAQGAGGAATAVLEGGSPHPRPLPEGEGTGAGTRVLEAVQAELAAVREARVALCGTLLDQRLAACGLPAAAQERLRKQFGDRVFEAGSLEGEITSLRELLGSVAAPGVVTGMGFPRADGFGRVQIGMTAKDRMEKALERLFGLPIEDPKGQVPRLSGIKEAYVLITGDKRFTGRYNWEESVLREANEVTVASMDDLFANVLNKRLTNDYKAQSFWWEPIVEKVALKDMMLQTRVRLSDFAALSTVAEDAAYTNLAWSDDRESYSPTKRGNLVTITLESIINDDLHGIQRIPKKLATAAAVTVNEYVASLFTMNASAGPIMGDGFNVFDAVNHQGNKGITALSSTALAAAITVMMKYTNVAGKRLNVVPKFLLIPADLLWTARVIVQSAGVPGSNWNDVNTMQGAVNIVPVPQFTEVDDWFLMADPNLIDGIELGFLDGREVPELLVQDNPTVGSVFTNDAIAYKVRHIYGGTFVDYRCAYASIV